MAPIQDSTSYINKDKTVRRGDAQWSMGDTNERFRASVSALGLPESKALQWVPARTKKPDNAETTSTFVDRTVSRDETTGRQAKEAALLRSALGHSDTDQRTSRSIARDIGDGDYVEQRSQSVSPDSRSRRQSHDSPANDIVSDPWDDLGVEIGIKPKPSTSQGYDAMREARASMPKILRSYRKTSGPYNSSLQSSKRSKRPLVPINATQGRTIIQLGEASEPSMLEDPVLSALAAAKGKQAVTGLADPSVQRTIPNTLLAPPASIEGNKVNISLQEVLRLEERIQTLQIEVESLKASNAVLENALNDQGAFTTMWPVLHRVHCEENFKTLTYADQPRLTDQGDADHEHLEGQRHIISESRWEDRAGDHPFVVYLEYDCPDEGNIDDQRHRVPASRSKLRSMRDSVRPNREEVHILRESLFDTLAEILESCSGLEAYSRHGLLSTDVLEAPYPFFYQFETYFEKRLADVDGSEHQDLQLLIQYFRQHTLHLDWLSQDSRFNTHAIPEFMPFLFVPGDLVITYSKKGHHARVLRQTSVLEMVSQSSPNDQSMKHKNAPGHDDTVYTWSLQAAMIEFNGEFREVKTTFEIKLKANESIDIKCLPVYPLRFQDANNIQNLLARGRIFSSCINGRYVSASGDTGQLQSSDTDRYMVDVLAFHTLHRNGTDKIRHLASAPENSAFHFTRLHPFETQPVISPELADDDFLIQLPDSIEAYHMDEKKWVQLPVENIAPHVDWNKGAFESLAIDPDTKEIIEALVKNKIESDQSIDFVQGKGNGLIILLHGGPGTGKTLTAESVAEIAEKPLYRVTCGDIGIDPVKVEEYLESVFYLGRRWKSVVLLDEADVFLQQRDRDNLARNSLVSVFLRRLEYYDGILILTSNRVGIFDEAFKSRIQLALHYPKLTEDQRAQIWTNFINRLATFKEADQELDIDSLRQSIPIFSRFEMNGRQIRNCINNARGLAKSKAVRLNAMHMTTVMKVGQRFEDYLVGRKGFDDDDFALDQKLR